MTLHSARRGSMKIPLLLKKKKKNVVFKWWIWCRFCRFISCSSPFCAFCAQNLFCMVERRLLRKHEHVQRRVSVEKRVHCSPACQSWWRCILIHSWCAWQQTSSLQPSFRCCLATAGPLSTCYPTRFWKKLKRPQSDKQVSGKWNGSRRILNPCDDK